ncbi:hypothetical protein V1509DRAFT_621674 [Lipomyces kononenkoae]
MTLPMPDAAVHQWDALSAEFEGINGHWLQKLQDHDRQLRSSDAVPTKQLQEVIEDLMHTSTSLFQALVSLQKHRLEIQRQYVAWYEDYKRECARMTELATEADEEYMREHEKRKAAEEELVQVREDEARQRWMLDESRRELQVARLECRRAWAEVTRLEEYIRRLTEQQQHQGTGIMSSPDIGSSPLRTVQHVPASPLSSRYKGKSVFRGEPSRESVSGQRHPHDLEPSEEETSFIGDIEIADSDRQKRLHVRESQFWIQRAQEQIPPGDNTAGPSTFPYSIAGLEISPTATLHSRSRKSVDQGSGIF